MELAEHCTRSSEVHEDVLTFSWAFALALVLAVVFTLTLLWALRAAFVYKRLM